MVSTITFSIASSFLCLTLCGCFLNCLAFTFRDYAAALEKSILFFEGQRSGKLPPKQRLSWRADSGLSDGSSANVDLTGGYYDAGDNVKFGFPMAFTTTLLAWSVIEFGSSMGPQIGNAKAAVRWGSDYLLKAANAIDEGFLFVQVGDPYLDHKCWERPEDMDTPRNVSKVTTEQPGSDVAAETAAALAASSMVFNGSDPSYSSKLLRTAKKVFSFADTNRGRYSDSLKSMVCPFYCSWAFEDELLWGASWLYAASRSSQYRYYIRYNGDKLGADDDDDYSFNWDNKNAGTKVLLSKEYLEGNDKEFQSYKRHADNFVCSLVPGTQSFQQNQYTPGGLLYKGDSSNLQSVTSTTLLLLTYAKYLNSSGRNTSAQCGQSSIITAKMITEQAKKQVDYILGDNPAKMSYMVGLGPRYPKHVHHRASSLPSIRQHPRHIGCNEGFGYFNSTLPNPNLLIGAIVGGPDKSDNFTDDRKKYQQTEPATYINAPFVGAVAFFSAHTN